MGTSTARAAAATNQSSGQRPAAQIYIPDTSKYRNRLRRLEGQIRGIDRMITEERYCLDILTQIAAVDKALGAVALGLLEDHLRRCILDAAASGRPVSELKISELCRAMSRLVRS